MVAPIGYERWEDYLWRPIQGSPQVYTYEQWAKDLNAIIRDQDHKIIKTPGELQNIHLVGFSMGGAVAMQYMTDYNPPETKVKQCTLISAAGPSMGSTMQNAFDFPVKQRLEAVCVGLYIFAVLIWADAPDAFDALLELIFPYVDCEPTVDGKNPTRDWIKASYESLCTDAKIGACLEMHSDHPELVNNVKNIDTPTKIIHGCSDPFVPLRLGQYTQSTIPGTLIPGNTDRRFSPIPYTGHGIFFEQSAKLSQELYWSPW